MSTNPFRTARNTQNNQDTFSPGMVQQSLRTKQQIINELIAGRLKLLEATARFKAAHSAVAACVASATGRPVANDDNENMCRTVIGWVYLTLSGRPEEAERISASLERELQGMLETRNQVHITH